MADKPCCACKMEKKLRIEFLYLAMEEGSACAETAKVLDDAIKDSTTTLKIAGYGIEYKKVQIANEEMAKEYCFAACPTIRVNDEDLYLGDGVDVPAKSVLSQGLLRCAFSPDESRKPDRENYAVPKDLQDYFHM